MRILKTIFLLVFTTSFLMACSGGSSETSTSSSSGGSDLVSAYYKIEGGMSYQQVRDIVGFDYTTKFVNGSFYTQYIWQAGDIGQSNFGTLSITDSGKGVKSKIISATVGKDIIADIKSFPGFD